MTSASELFYTRRSRFGRNTHLELGGEQPQPPPPLDSHFHRISHHNNRRSNRHTSHHNHHHSDDFDHHLPRRSPHNTRLHHRPSLPDRESGWLDQGSSQSTSGEVNVSQNGRTLRESQRSASSERLPGTVLLARERLLQRLRGVSLNANRQRNRVSSSIHHNDIMSEGDIRLANGRDWENEVPGEWFAGAIPFTDMLSLEKTKRPPGLTQEALDNLQVEIFSKFDDSGEDAVSRGLEECSICLESFLEGDKLIFLTCGHRFHCYCLDPWVRICGDCPYCRKAILITTCRGKDKREIFV